MQVINDPKYNAGSYFGTKVSGALSNLIDQKVGELHQRNRVKDFVDAGFSPEESKLYSTLDPQSLKILAPLLQQNQEYKDYLSKLNPVQNEPPSAGESFRQETNQEQQQQQRQFQAPSPIEMLLNSMNQGQQNPLTSGLSQQPFQPQFGQQGPQPLAPEIQQALQQQQKLSPVQRPSAPGQQAQPMPEMQPVQQNAPAKPLTKAEFLKNRAQVAEENKLLREKGFNETQELRADLQAKDKSARAMLRDLERLEELKDLDTAGYVEFLKRSGFDIPTLMKTDSQEFQKTTQNFTKDMKARYGAKVSNQEMEQFLKTIPSLSMSPEGRQRVINVMKFNARADIAYNDAKREVLAVNRGLPPVNLADQVEDKVAKKIDVLSRKLREEMLKPVPKGQNRYITALQAATGSAIGKVGPIGITAAIGGLAGGPIGALGGAALPAILEAIKARGTTP